MTGSSILPLGATLIAAGSYKLLSLKHQEAR